MRMVATGDIIRSYLQFRIHYIAASDDGGVMHVYLATSDVGVMMFQN